MINDHEMFQQYRGFVMPGDIPCKKPVHHKGQLRVANRLRRALIAQRPKATVMQVGLNFVQLPRAERA